jgi:hypothetical protein
MTSKFVSLYDIFYARWRKNATGQRDKKANARKKSRIAVLSCILLVCLDGVIDGDMRAGLINGACVSCMAGEVLPHKRIML